MKKDRRTTRTYCREGDEAFFLEEDESELLSMPRNEVIAELTERERKFCEYLIHNYNIKVAAVKAGYSPDSAHIIGWRVRTKYTVNRYICWLKLRLSKKLFISAVDLMDQYAKQAFADITDFVDFNGKTVVLKNSANVDGQLIKRVKSSDKGIELELEDRQAALDKLVKYFDVMPRDWRQAIEERKVNIMEQRLEMDKQLAGFGLKESEDDGFFEALVGAAKECWSDVVVEDGNDEKDTI